MILPRVYPIPRFYPILDTEAARRCGIDVVTAANEILEGGARILQVRHKGFLSRDIVNALERIANLCREANVPLIVNDRADLARLWGSGLHLGQDDLPPPAARRIVGNSAVVGFSTHNETQLRAAGAEPVDYLALGPIFGTVSKANPDPVVGIEGLRRLRALTIRPLVAIGGITRANADEVLAAGADSVAVIGDLFPDSGGVSRRVREWLAVLS